MFFNETNNYFHEECENILRNTSCGEFLEKCKSRFIEENQRIDEHFEPANKYLITELFHKIYIVNNIRFLLENEENGLKSFLIFDKFEDISNLYFFMSFDKSCLELFKKQLVDYILQNLSPLLIPSKHKKNFINIIEKIFIFKEKIYKIQEKALKSKNIESDKNTEKAIKDCFLSFFNKESIISNSLNKYIDFFMQKGHKKLNESERECNIEKIIDIFKYLTNKDVFEIYYKKLLTKRLLIFKNSYEELEVNFLKKITIICGTFFTSKFYAFFKDILISSENFNEFQRYFHDLKQKPKFQLDFHKFQIEVVSQSIWSFEENNENFEFSEDIFNTLKIFEKFYQWKHPERKLKWMATIGVGVIKAYFKDKTKELILSNIQIFVLLCFNQKRSLSFKEIQAKLKINSVNLLKICLKSFIRYKILLRNNSNNAGFDSVIEIKDEDIFIVNEHFAHRNYEIKIPLKQNDDDVEKLEQKNFDTLLLERKIIIESYLIRILKARKKIIHTDLIREVCNFCANKNFVPNVGQIKDSIESLINREYIKRNEDVNWYSYIA